MTRTVLVREQDARNLAAGRTTGTVLGMTTPADEVFTPEEARCCFCGGIIEARGDGSWVNLAGDTFCTFTPPDVAERHHRPV